MKWCIVRCVAYIWLCGVCFSCAGLVPSKDKRVVDQLNSTARSFVYTCTDSASHYALMAYHLAKLYPDGKAEAASCQGLSALTRCNLPLARYWYTQVYHLTKNELELLVADVGMMEICRRTAMNQDFYRYRQSALRRMTRINEDEDLFLPHSERKRYAESQFYMVSTLYYLQLRQTTQAKMMMERLNVVELASDTTLLLGYHYLKGVFDRVWGDSDETYITVFNRFFYLWRLAELGNNPFYQACALWQLADMLADKRCYAFIRSHSERELSQFNHPVDSLLPLLLAQQAQHIFALIGDQYHAAMANVTVSKYHNACGEFTQALDVLSTALGQLGEYATLYTQGLNTTFTHMDNATADLEWVSNPQGNAIPQWLASIREQLSVTYAGLDNKPVSDHNRNIYLDILSFIRQNKEREARLQYLETQNKRMTIWLAMFILALTILVTSLSLYDKRAWKAHLRNSDKVHVLITLCMDIVTGKATIPQDAQLMADKLFGKNRLRLNMDHDLLHWDCTDKLTRREKLFINFLQPYLNRVVEHNAVTQWIEQELSNVEKRLYIENQQYITHKRQNIIKRACLSIVNNMLPYPDRLLHEIRKLSAPLPQNKVMGDKSQKYSYLWQLIQTINNYSRILTLWIQIKQGMISLKIESFAISEIFATLQKSKMMFEHKGINFIVEHTHAYVKADKALTLFMLNTLADNAKKYTSSGGEVRIFAKSEENYVEISVQDTGCGLTRDEINRILNQKVYPLPRPTDVEDTTYTGGSGFGLMNCKRIIEKYKNTGSFFQHCSFSVESEKGKGSRFFFRLPMAIRNTARALVCIFLLSTMASCGHNTTSSSPLAMERVSDSTYNHLLTLASDYADAAYFANIDQQPALALAYVDSSMLMLNLHYERFAQPDKPHHYMSVIGHEAPAELGWWEEDYLTDYHVILDLRNEAAVAALSLQQQDVYSYNNDAFTNLYTLLGQDESLAWYSNELQRNNNNVKTGLILCAILFLVIALWYYHARVRQRAQDRVRTRQIPQIDHKILSLCRVTDIEGMVTALSQNKTAFLKELIQTLISGIEDLVNQIIPLQHIGIAIYNETDDRWSLISSDGFTPSERITSMLSQCAKTRQVTRQEHFTAFTLNMPSATSPQALSVFYLFHRDKTLQPSDAAFAEMVAQHIALLVLGPITGLSTPCERLERTNEHTLRLRWENSLLHTRNLVLDNSLSAIKHETLYYPTKMERIATEVSAGNFTQDQDNQRLTALSELTEYYKEILTTLTLCANRNASEVMFKRGVIPIEKLFVRAETFFHDYITPTHPDISLATHTIPNLSVLGDATELDFLIQNIILGALHCPLAGELRLKAESLNGFALFTFTDKRVTKTSEELNSMFHPDFYASDSISSQTAKGVEYLLCKQIIRNHVDSLGNTACRIYAQPDNDTGYRVCFTIPLKTNKQTL